MILVIILSYSSSSSYKSYFGISICFPVNEIGTEVFSPVEGWLKTSLDLKSWVISLGTVKVNVYLFKVSSSEATLCLISS